MADPEETLAIQGPDGPSPGIPIAYKNGRAQPVSGGVAADAVPDAASPEICLRCLVARAVVIAALAVALGVMIYLERRKKASMGENADGK